MSFSRLVLHFLLISLRLGRLFKSEFRLTKRGTDMTDASLRLFAELLPDFVLRIDHAFYARFDDRPFRQWEVIAPWTQSVTFRKVAPLRSFAAHYTNGGCREMDQILQTPLSAHCCRSSKTQHSSNGFNTPIFPLTPPYSRISPATSRTRSTLSAAIDPSRICNEFSNPTRILPPIRWARIRQSVSAAPKAQSAQAGGVS